MDWVICDNFAENVTRYNLWRSIHNEFWDRHKYCFMTFFLVIHDEIATSCINRFLVMKGYDSIWVVVDRLTKSAHFIPVGTRYSTKRYAELYLEHILCLHGIPKTIISDRGSQFIARFWEQLHTFLGTHLIRSSTYQPSDWWPNRENKPDIRGYASCMCLSL